MSTSPEKAEFADRLQQLCTDMGITEGRGRNTALAAIFKVTPNAARKWLLGLGLPEYDVAMAIAKWGSVNFEWLMTGRGPKRGSLIDMKGLVLDEALRSLGPDARHEALDFIKYKLDRARAHMLSERLGRYMEALDAADTQERAVRDRGAGSPPAPKRGGHS